MSELRLSIVLSIQAAQFTALAFKGEIESNLVKIARLGYGGVELAIRDPALVDTASLVKALKQNGLCVPAIGTGQAWSEEGLSISSPDESIRKAALARLKGQIQLAAKLEALVIIGLIRGRTLAGQTQDQSKHTLVRSLKECAEVAANSRVRLALEPINRYETDLIHTAAEGVELIEQVGAPNLGLLLDTFHMNIEEDRIEDTIREFGVQIYHFHIADSNRWYPGAGHLDFKLILQALKATGYQGWISGEFMPYPDPDTAAGQNIAFLRSL